MQKILIFSDLHICAPGERIIDLDPSARFEMVLEAALADHPDAAAIVLLGDLTHHGHPDEYRELHRIIANVRTPIVPMMGNHDERATFLAQFPDAQRMPSGHLQHHFDIENHRIITLDSLDGPPYRVGHHLGRLCDDRITFLDDALTTRDGRHATVFIHHPPFDTGILGMDMIKLEDGEALLDLLSNHGNLHVICGHIHRTINGQTKGVPWTVLKSPCHQGLVDLDTPNSHLSTDEAGAYGLVLLTDNGVIIHHQDVGTGARVFGGYGTED